MRTTLRSILVLLAGCSSKPTAPAMDFCSAALPKGAHSTASSDGTAGICIEPAQSPTVAPASDIAPMGYTALGAAIAFSGAAGPFPHGVDFTVPADLAKGPSGAEASRIVVVEKRASGQTLVVSVANVTYEDAYHRLHFHSDELGTYQAAIPESAGQMVTRHYVYRGIGGASMGGIGSSMNFWRHPERYDVLTVMGADPGPDLTYTLGVTQSWFFAGFCTVDDEKAGRGKLGQLCAPTRKPLADQGELSFDFEHLLYQPGEGVGLTLRRQLYVRAFRDLSRAFGNAAYPSAMGKSTYLPPGLDQSAIEVSNADFCAKPVVLKNFFDGKYNPDGAKDVITFCDGGDSMAKGYGVYDDSQPQTDPTQILLAVDLNGNGKRDSGEPVVVQGGEPFQDVGTDGKADADEPGYDPQANPDPSHDDYHWLHNPTGTENNWRYDAGEPYDDFGTDGVKGKGCPVGTGAQCYDYGEGNGKYDHNPNADNWYAHDPRSLIEKLPESQLDRLDVYYDAGIRDFFNAHVSTNSLMGALEARGRNVRVWQGFPSLVGQAPSEEAKFEVTKVDWAHLGRRVYVKYGDPDVPEAVVEQTGDGRHVGTASQAVHRAQSLFYFMSSAWPDGDYDPNGDAPDPVTSMFTASNGRVTPYVVILPPGYNDPANAAKRYPVGYFMHGYGMDPTAFSMIGAIAQSAMVNPTQPLQKFIIVVADAKCRPGGDIASMEPLPVEGDLCEEGGFYTDHPDGTYHGEQELIELQDLIDKMYRTKAPEDRMVRQ